MCDERRFGSPSRKQVIMYLADKASDDGAGIWCSKYTIAKHTELSLATIKRIIREFIVEGVLVKTGDRPCDRGYTVVFRISLEQISSLPELDDDQDRDGTGVTVNSVHDDPSTEVTMTPVGGSSRPPNHPLTIQEPPTRASTREGAVGEDSECDMIWNAYPADRQRNKNASLTLARSAIEGGEVTLDELVSAVSAYASESAGYTRSKVSYSDNWFRNKRWQRYVIMEREAGHEKAAKRKQALAGLAEWVVSKSGLCHTISRAQAEAILQAGLVTTCQLRAAGVDL
jgi:hypothetical protein